MRRVDRPEQAPHTCAFTLKGQDPEGFFTELTVLRGLDPVVYAAASWVRQAARQLGMVHHDEHQMVVGELEQANHRIAQLEDEVAHLNRDFEAIDILESKGFRSRRKPGRPKVEREAA